MGQRHQLFVIAKIGHTYRKMAVLHHQWLYGHTAVSMCSRLCHIFSASANREALRTELILARKVDSETWGEKGNPCAFPFIFTCLMLGATFCVERHHNSTFHPEFLSLRFDGGSNNNGITIVDISNLDAIRYCFVNWEGVEDESTEEDWNVPLSGERYLKGYYPVEEQSADMLETIADLEHFQVMDEDMLDLAWNSSDTPDEQGMESISTQAGHLSLDGTRPLRDAALSTFLRQLFEQDQSELPKLLEHAQQLPGFDLSLKEYVLTHPELVTSKPIGVDLLKLVVAKATTVDLSPFPALDETQLFSILSQFNSFLTSLNLSGISAVTVQLLRKLPTLAPTLKTLYVMGIPGLSMGIVHEVALALNTDNVYHSGAFAAPFEPLVRFLRLEDGASENFASWNCREYRDLELENNTLNMPLTQMLLFSASPSGYEADLADFVTQPAWNTSERPCIFPLLSATTTLQELFGGIRRFLSFMQPSEREPDSSYSVLAKCIALSEPPSPTQADWQVKALPAKLQIVGKARQHNMDRGIPFPPRALRAGEWTLILMWVNVLITDTALPRLKYCFVTTPVDMSNATAPSSDPLILTDMTDLELQVCDVREFVASLNLPKDESQILISFWDQLLVLPDAYESLERMDERAARALLGYVVNEWSSKHEKTRTELLAAVQASRKKQGVAKPAS